jgi:chemotaxis signal transduction protein
MAMKSPEENRESPAQSFEFILFMLADFLFGATAEQVTRIHSGEKIKPEELGRTRVDLGKAFHVPKETAAAHPCLLEVKTRTGMKFFEVDRVEGLTRLDLSQIRKLPPLIGSQKANRSFWGLALIGNRIACLVDLETLGTDEQSPV